MEWTAETLQALADLIRDHAWHEDAKGFTHNPQRKLDLARDLSEIAEAMREGK